MNINKLFIANRGEIAARIISTCKRLGIETVLGVSEADLNSPPAKLADHVFLLGPAPSTQSYLHVSKVVSAAKNSRCDAIHPGYGFLSENAALAKACAEKHITLIGPTEQQLATLGNKLHARKAAIQAGLTVVPGCELDSIEEAAEKIHDIGLPVLIKAVSGGGGRGMKIVRDKSELKEAINLAMAEAESAFGDKRVYLEHYISNGRHIEVQILSDGNNTVHLGTRDCSVQRRYQKLIEEAPAPGLSNVLQDAIQNAAITFTNHLHYQGLGTVEFLLDCDHEAFYFLEMNARIQVEHPVTEAITGLDLVAQQIRVAEARPLGIKQEDVRFTGHAIECRINAEDCNNNFSPSPGTITNATFPAGVNTRVDSHIQSGYVVPPYYDSLLGKLIVYGPDRAQTVKSMQIALSKTSIEGVETNVSLHQKIINDERFITGSVNTGFLSDFLAPNTSHDLQQEDASEAD